MMKKNIYRLRVVCAVMLALFCTTSCNDWLEVKPKTEEEADKLFSTLDGFKSALAGVYIGMSQTELYGREMTFGMVGVLGQEWGSGSDLGNQYSAYSYLLNYNYEQVVSKALIDAVWNKMYEGIANVNTLIQYSDLKREVLGDYYGVVRGEALALRAYMHFDLLRLFAPYDFSAEAKVAIPYVLEAKPAIAPQLTPTKFVEYALKDVEAALELLKSDPILTGEDVSGVDNGYLANRNFHLNYYAVLGLKARICLYAKDVTAAYGAANEVILAQQQKGLFPWVKTADITTTEANLRDRTFSSEHLFAFNTTKLEEYIKGYFREASLPLMERLMPGELYEADDYRTALYETYSGFANVLTKFWQMDKAYVQGQGYVTPKRNRMPAIRIAEMYYIAAEALKESNIGEALEMLNTLRVHRGLMKLENLDKDQLQEELGREYYREFIGEGQVFFYHKRMNTSIIATANAVYVLPMPDDEIDLGQREQ
ncbi:MULTISPECIES: RagB/SusD family nutrient uptake outer membrane protein [Butyricimonas]|jgi:putative uncharacterized protein (fragment)|uniref:RagB/SusD family nutrient uptake outer membrane protein n=1 Tax=Butyricimonas faecihominis TaxID=1472416 RepID=A0A7W6HXF8_9BACT|nr:MULTISPECIES: RagB/SusD family nutrient uptake outer membrane protein [Butyricimonas]MBS6689005.1 RagB/SusD family nutrient uptake outer membrane protein [Sanguibacteroides justesenii]KAB1507211.1 RagB/SusD family nutrient uptake outer membrane protein [Butyricimonas faecihominis]MBB4026739.1 hypothetical protein [Butyricimonas faecihominis]WOF09955.1 RagB/SusD family nutrient uptake outer membrane protein [Butyricimonas faecihominis]BEI57707.1 RagB/SusD family nutrient uptake outer membran